MKLSNLATAILPLAAGATSLVPNEYGLAGPQNAMLFLNGFHFISGAPDHFIHANHHCTIMTADPVFLQCLIYVPGTNPARVAGIEYIIGADAFEKLDYEEKQLWHSHTYEVTSGLLVEPGLPLNVDDEAMRILVSTYGKTVHTWRYDEKNNSLPLGIPELVNGYTQNGQLTAAAVDARDEYFNVSSEVCKESRAAAGIKSQKVIDGADIWEKGIILTLELKNTTGNMTFSGAREGNCTHVCSLFSSFWIAMC